MNKPYLLFTAVVIFFAPILYLTIWINDSKAESHISNNDEERVFQNWISLIKTKNSTISDYGNNSTHFNWAGFDGKLISVGVKYPRVGLKPKSIEVKSADLSSDSTKAFQEAFSRLKDENANQLNIEKGEYHFYKLVDSKVFSSKGLAHIYLENLKDVVINGNGATLVFHNNQPGIIVQQSQRLKIKNLILKFVTNDKSIASVVEEAGEKKLKLIAGNLPKENPNIFQVIELDEKGLFKPGGKRIVFAPEFSKPDYDGDLTFKHKLFQPFDINSKFLLLHYWYGGQAIKIDGDRDDNQTEDIAIENVTILSTPGMGITTTGLKRGLLIKNCQFGILNGQLNIMESPSWDAINVHQAGGDVIINKNTFYGMTDDAINLNNPIHTIQSYDSSGATVVLKTSSRFIQPSDRLAFFNSGGRFEGISTIISKKPLGGAVFAFTLNQIPENIKANWIVRDLDLFQGGYMIADNTFKNLSGHAILAQTINGLIENNKVQDITRNAIRLLSSVGIWKEGVGVVNVIVRKNTIENSGMDYEENIPWGAITLYSITDGAKLPEYLINDSVEISSNKIINPKQNCIAVTNTSNAKVIDNECILDGSSIKKYIVRKSVNVTTQ